MAGSTLISPLDIDACFDLLVAIQRRWWLDARHNQQMLCDLADWMEVGVDELVNSRPRPFRAQRSNNYDNLDEIPTNPWPRRSNFSAAYSRRGTGS